MFPSAPRRLTVGREGRRRAWGIEKFLPNSSEEQGPGELVSLIFNSDHIFRSSDFRVLLVLTILLDLQ